MTFHFFRLIIKINLVEVYQDMTKLLKEGQSEEPIKLPSIELTNMDESEKPKRRERGDSHRNGFVIAIIFSCMIVIPYALYAVKINSYGLIHKPEGYAWASYSSLWISFVSMTITHASFRAIRFFRPLVLRYVPLLDDDTGKALSDQKRVSIAIELEDHIVNTLGYGTFSIWAWYACKDEPWMPTFLGGKGNFAISAIDMPFINCNENLLTLGFANLGFRLESLFSHLVYHRDDNDFEEMLLHDCVTNFLFFGYIFSN